MSSHQLNSKTNGPVHKRRGKNWITSRTGTKCYQTKEEKQQYIQPTRDATPSPSFLRALGSRKRREKTTRHMVTIIKWPPFLVKVLSSSTERHTLLVVVLTHSTNTTNVLYCSQYLMLSRVYWDRLSWYLLAIRTLWRMGYFSFQVSVTIVTPRWQSREGGYSFV